MISDDLDALTPGTVETIAFWTCVAMMMVLVVGCVSFATGLLWADHIHPGIVHALVWWLRLLP